MAKYIIKESELHSAIVKIVEEELGGVIEESFGRVLGNTAKLGAKALLAPSLLTQDAVVKTHDILSGNDTITKSVSDFFGGKGGGGNSGNRKMTKAEKQRQRLSAGRGISAEYGRPETVPGFGRRMKLARKTEIEAPGNNNNNGNHIDWGTFGRHYHDEGDRAWNRKVADTEAALRRNARNASQARVARLQRRYKRMLVDWLKERDRNYEIYIKSIN